VCRSLPCTSVLNFYKDFIYIFIYIFIFEYNFYFKTGIDYQTVDKKLTNLMGNLCCAREHPVKFFVQFFYTVKLPTKSVWAL